MSHSTEPLVFTQALNLHIIIQDYIEQNVFVGWGEVKWDELDNNEKI